MNDGWSKAEIEKSLTQVDRTPVVKVEPDNRFKYRAFDTRGCMHCFTLLGLENGDMCGRGSCDLSEMIIMEWAGVQDGNGEDVYEGDWLRTRNGYIGEVCWINGRFDCGDMKQLDWAMDEDGEVIGNVYEGKRDA